MPVVTGATLRETRMLALELAKKVAAMEAALEEKEKEQDNKRKAAYERFKAKQAAQAAKRCKEMEPACKAKGVVVPPRNMQKTTMEKTGQEAWRVMEVRRGEDAKARKAAKEKAMQEEAKRDVEARRAEARRAMEAHGCGCPAASMEAKRAMQARRAVEVHWAMECKKAEEARRAVEAHWAMEAKKAEEARRAMEAQAMEAKKAEEARRAMEAQAMEARRAEEARRAKKAEEARRAMEAQAMEAKKAEEARRAKKAEEARRAMEAQAMEAKKAEEARRAMEAQAMEAKKAEQARRAMEAQAVEAKKAKAEQARWAMEADVAMEAKRANDVSLEEVEVESINSDGTDFSQNLENSYVEVEVDAELDWNGDIHMSNRDALTMKVIEVLSMDTVSIMDAFPGMSERDFDLWRHCRFQGPVELSFCSDDEAFADSVANPAAAAEFQKLPNKRRKVKDGDAFTGGMGGMEIVKLHLEKSIEYWAREKNKKLLVDGMPFISGTSFHAVDLDPVCQETITSQPFPPLHVFSDMVLLLVPSARVAVLKTMEQHRDAIQADLATCSSRTAAQDDKDGAKAAIREKGEHVLESLLQAMDPFDPLFVEVADCTKHDGAKCDVLPAQADLDAALSFMMAGTSCVDWSSMGGSLTLAGWTVLPFAIQLKLVQRIRPTVFFHVQAELARLCAKQKQSKGSFYDALPPSCKAAWAACCC
ncbi:unnamed protein product [Effrenium voratum]|uniref:Uncharacterized protein n=1 Tax=Effrenium voratum TaxID=2562239 RepID=A0AA36IF92_9DINO|nr:unnamed protein product [Effrenium voratum]